MTTFRASNPGSTRWIWAKLRTINPAPIRSTSDSATSRTTSTLRSLLPRTPPVSAPRSRSASARLPPTARSAGASPNTIAATHAAAAANRSAREVDGRPFDTRQVARTQRRDEPDALPRQEHAEHGARPGEHGALDQHLRDDAAAAAADRGPHRDLASTLGRPDQQQVRDVGARDQQHEPDGAEEGEQSGPRVAHDITVHPVHPDLQVLGLVELVDLAQPRGDRVHLLLRLFQRDAVAAA